MLLTRSLFTFVACLSHTLQDSVFPWVRREKIFRKFCWSYIGIKRLLMIYTKGEREVLQCKNVQNKLISQGNVLTRKEHAHYSYNRHSFIFPMSWYLKGQSMRLLSLTFCTFLPPLMGVMPLWIFLMRQSQIPLNCPHLPLEYVEVHSESILNSKQCCLAT